MRNDQHDQIMKWINGREKLLRLALQTADMCPSLPPPLPTWLLVMSLRCFFLNSEVQYSTMRLSKSSPPKWVSPAVALTSKMPSSMVRRDTSKVPGIEGGRETR